MDLRLALVISTLLAGCTGGGGGSQEETRTTSPEPFTAQDLTNEAPSPVLTDTLHFGGAGEFRLEAPTEDDLSQTAIPLTLPQQASSTVAAWEHIVTANATVDSANATFWVRFTQAAGTPGEGVQCALHATVRLYDDGDSPFAITGILCGRLPAVVQAGDYRIALASQEFLQAPHQLTPGMRIVVEVTRNTYGPEASPYVFLLGGMPALDSQVTIAGLAEPMLPAKP